MMVAITRMTIPTIGIHPNAVSKKEAATPNQAAIFNLDTLACPSASYDFPNLLNA